MKKLLGILVALMLVLGMAGQSMAAFSTNLELFRITYTTGSAYEVISDLGTIGTTFATNGSGVISNTYTNLAGGSNAWYGNSSANFSTSTPNLYVAYLAFDVTSNAFYLSGNAGGQPGGINDPSSALYTFTQGQGSGSSTITQQRTVASNSYWQQINNSGNNTATFAGFYPAATGEALIGAGGATQSLYYFANGANGSAGLAAATIVTNADGSTSINPSAVPIPAAVWLLGSGLLGLIGIRRRSA